MDTRQRGLIILLATLLGGVPAFSLTSAAPAASAAAATDSAFASGDSSAAASLAASTGVPWNPPHALASGKPWEQALRFPGFILSLPLVVLGSITDHALAGAEDTKFFPKAIAVAQYPASRGLIILPATLGDRTGIGVAARLYPPGIGKYFNIEWQGTTLKYSKTTLRAGRGPLILDYEFEWRPQDLFFGLGPNSSTKNESNFAGESQHLLLTLSLRRRIRRMRVDTQAWGGERSLVTREGKDSSLPSIDQVFPIYASNINQREDYLTGGASVTLDARVAGVQRWISGWRAGVTAQSFNNQTNTQLLFPRSDATSRFVRLRYEGEVGYSFFKVDPRTVRLLVRVIDQNLEAGVLQPLDLNTLGGNVGLSGFEGQRFHDLDLGLARLTYLFPLGKHLEMDVHTEVGSVYRDLWHDAKWSNLRNSYGFALRPRTDTAVLGAIGIDWSVEQTRVLWSLGGAQ
jgi:hypothetical protein